MTKSVPGKNRKLYENFINNCYYEPKKFLIETPEEELIKKFYGEIDNAVESGDDHFATYSVAHQLHELCHYIHQIGTPMCLFENLISITSLIQTSYYIKLFKGTIKLPFYEHRKEYPSFLTNSYTFSRDLNLYLYSFFEPSEVCPLERINKIELREEYSGAFRKLTHGKQKKLLPTLFVSFNQNIESFPEFTPYIPVGLFTILEGFATAVQDHFLLHYFPPEKTHKNNADIVSESKFLPYYLLRYYCQKQLEGLKRERIAAIFLYAMYLSLMNFSPIYHKKINFRPDMGANPDEMQEFFSLLDHPSETFFNAFNALREIVEKKGGIEPGEKGAIKLINKACQNIGMPPIDVIYDSFSSFLIEMITEYYPQEFKEFPFAMHYFDIGLKVMKIAKDNPYAFMVFPTEILEKIGTYAMPYSIKGQGCAKVATPKIVWYSYYTVMEQFFHKKRIFCDEKYLEGTNPSCKNDRECSIDNYDYPYSKCEKWFLHSLNLFLGDFNKLVPA